MAKVEIDLVRKVLQRNDVELEIITQILDDLEIEVSKDGDGVEPAGLSPEKKQFVILVSDPEGKLKEDLFVGWVLQISESQSPMEIGTHLFRAAYEFNHSKKGARDPVKTVTDVCEIVPAKTLRAQSIWVKTKEPVLVVRTDNRIPLTPPPEEPPAPEKLPNFPS
ncbi:MAG: hypothetical protein LBS68_00770 [Puniceicoccales bacterium]|jgi:hypothetical protein|nr:hypothetical protein [Puniceicoccales bacterium]